MIYNLTEEQQELIDNNLQLIPWVYTRYYPTVPRAIYENFFLLAGYEALAYAATKWEPERGSFTTIAVFELRRFFNNELRVLEKRYKNEVSLERTIIGVSSSNGSTIFLKDTLSDPNSDLSKVDEEDFKKFIAKKAMSYLSDKSNGKDIQMLKLWIEGKTYEEIGKLFNVSRQRVGELMKIAKRRLRNKMGPYLRECGLV